MRPLRGFIVSCRVRFFVKVERRTIFVVETGRRLNVLSSIRILDDDCASRELIDRYSVLRYRNDGLVDDERGEVGSW